MKTIMTRAWEISRNAVVKFGGKVKEYFSNALKLAWSEHKKPVKKAKRTFSEVIKDAKQKEVVRFFGAVKNKSNKYFTFNPIIDNDNIILITNDIKFIKDTPVLVVDNNKVVYLKEFNLREVHNFYEGFNAYAVKLSRKYFKTYTFKSTFDDFGFESEQTFDDLKEIAMTQDGSIALGMMK